MHDNKNFDYMGKKSSVPAVDNETLQKITTKNLM